MDTNWNFRSFSLVMKYSFDLKKTLKNALLCISPPKVKPIVIWAVLKQVVGGFGWWAIVC